MKKRVLSLFMALALCFSLLPTAAFAETAGADPSSPYTVGEDTDGQDKKTDEAAAAVQKLLDALPDEVTEENAADIEAQLMAIDEAMAALSEAQLAMLDMTRYDAICAPLTGLTAEQANTHSDHPVCGDADCTEHGKPLAGWVGVDDLSDIKSAGNYYLKKDVTIDDQWQAVNDVVLCLNGYSISSNLSSSISTNGVIQISSDVTFTLTDCNGSGQNRGIITHESGKNGRGVYVADGGVFYMYGGEISGNTITEKEQKRPAGGLATAKNAPRFLDARSFTGSSPCDGPITKKPPLLGALLFNGAGERT